nr:MAG TPA: hypothetical protein [Caudoviricetes sp.]
MTNPEDKARLALSTPVTKWTNKNFVTRFVTG